MPLFDIHDVSFSYHTLKGEINALSHINITANSGEFIAVVGPSGCGKSTLLSLIAGLLVPEEGSITLDKEVKIGYMLQKDLLLNWLNIYENVTLGLELQKRKDNENLEFVNKLLNEYELYDFRFKKPSELSGGMRQRAALIRTIALKPNLLLLDEPFSALDFQTRLLVSADIASIIRKNNMTAVMITHDLSEAITLADRVIMLGKRPASVVCDIPIEITQDRSNPIEVRSTKAFIDYFNYLWEALTAS